MARDLDSIATHTVSRDGIKTNELETELEQLGPRWTREKTELKLVLAGAMAKTGLAAAAFAKLADELDHHPKIVLDYAGLTLTIHTHDAKSITVLDLVFAARAELWLRENGWPV